jgi:hypothetical protein
VADHTIEKPTIFISHATSDAEFAVVIQREIEKVFANGVTVFCTSSPGAIAAGGDWLHEIEQKLNSAHAVIAIVTPVSIERPWLWFEVGATWSKGRQGDCRIYPLCTKEIVLSDLPAPLNRLQALSLARAVDLKLLFESLIEQFGFGNIKAFKASTIIARVPKYSSVKVTEVDLAERAFYNGKYTGYSDDELVAVLAEYVVGPDYRARNDYFQSIDSNLCFGKLLHFRQLDKQYDLPPGTCKRLLVTAAAGFGLLPTTLTENTVRFELAKESGTRSAQGA